MLYATTIDPSIIFNYETKLDLTCFHINYVSTNLICILKSFLGIVVQLFILVHPLVHFLEESIMEWWISL